MDNKTLATIIDGTTEKGQNWLNGFIDLDCTKALSFGIYHNKLHQII